MSTPTPDSAKVSADPSAGEARPGRTTRVEQEAQDPSKKIESTAGLRTPDAKKVDDKCPDGSSGIIYGVLIASWSVRELAVQPGIVYRLGLHKLEDSHPQDICLMKVGYTRDDETF